MRAKKPRIIHIDKLIEETGSHFIAILHTFKDKIKELENVNSWREEDFRSFRQRLAALEKAESDRQAHEVTK